MIELNGITISVEEAEALLEDVRRELMDVSASGTIELTFYPMFPSFMHQSVNLSAYENTCEYTLDYLEKECGLYNNLSYTLSMIEDPSYHPSKIYKITHPTVQQFKTQKIPQNSLLLDEFHLWLEQN